jgi:hypothetical protein
MKIKRKDTRWDDSTYVRTDMEIIEAYLTPRYSNSSGQIEQLQEEVRDLRSLLAELLVQLHGQTVVDLCEDKE